MPNKHAKRSALLDPRLILGALGPAFRKFRPENLLSNPILLATAVISLIATFVSLHDAAEGLPYGMSLQISFWLWVTVFSGNFAEAIAEGRGKAHADDLRKAKSEVMAKKVPHASSTDFKLIRAADLRIGDYVFATLGDVIPADGQIVKGIATVDESTITGESAPVIRESGGNRSAVTGGTRVISDGIVVEIRANPNDSSLDHMIGIVEGAKRQKTPGEMALMTNLMAVSFALLAGCVVAEAVMLSAGTVVPVIYLLAFLTALMPTLVGTLLSSVSIAGLERLVTFNVIAKSVRAVEAAGRVDFLLLDKTGTITVGNRIASEFIPAAGVTEEALADAAMLASLQDETSEGTSIVKLAEERFGWKAAERIKPQMKFVPFSAYTRMSGVDVVGLSIRKGAPDTILFLCGSSGDAQITAAIERVAKTGGTPLLVARDKKLMGVLHLKDAMKPELHPRFAYLRRMGIRTVMITGDNPFTAAAIGAEAGVDDFLSEATPEKKLELIRREQGKGHLIAMSGDGSNDAPALAQADVGIAMNAGAMSARDAANMIDLDNDPTKLIEIAVTGKKLLLTRNALATFSLFKCVAVFFAFLDTVVPPPARGLSTDWALANLMRLTSPSSAVLSVTIFNALTPLAFLPLALHGVTYRPESDALARVRNLAVYGLGGLIVPFVGIKLIDFAVNWLFAAPL